MSGYKIPRRTALLTFDGGDYAGAEVRVRLDEPIGHFIEVIEKLNSGDFGSCCDGLVGILDSWNLERDDGTPIPATREGINELPLAFIIDILRHWITAQVQPSAPLVAPSRNGAQPPAPPVPMVALSGNPGS